MLLVALAFALPASAQTSLDLLGDKDCFGTGLACAEGSSLSSWSLVTTEPSDPFPTDYRHWAEAPEETFSWTHYLASSATSAELVIRTAGIADVAGPYDVFWDGIKVGAMPLDGFGHIIVETFSLGLGGTSLAAGAHTVSFTASSADWWAIDYSEVVGTAVPEPAGLSLLAVGMFGLVAVGRRRAT